jgi:hypothetical protein
MTKTATIIFLIACTLAGCDMHADDTRADWTKQQKQAWVQQARAECRPNGHSMDSGSGGYTIMREVLLCPDGTLRIVPLKQP